ncbi:MAG: alpha/beta hydrolase [Bacteroidota bacterium]
MTSVSRKNGQLVYEVFGTGNQILLAFHGFGQDRKIFGPWARILREDFKIYAFDLFYHGESTRRQDYLSKEEWKHWLEDFLQKEGIDHFSVLGYSLGGRFAIAAAMSFPDRVEALYLIGPDGIFLTPWFRLATTPGLRWVFKLFMYHPNVMARLLNFNSRFEVINPYVIDFIKKEMGDTASRKRIYRAWNYFKTLGYKKDALVECLKHSTFSKLLIVGEKDQIIKPSGILPLIKEIAGFEVVTLPLKHHQLARPQVAKAILDLANRSQDRPQ